MPLRATTIRFDDQAARLVQEAADEAGVSFSQFVREAALIRAVVRAMRDPTIHADEVVQALHSCSERVVKLSRVDNHKKS